LNRLEILVKGLQEGSIADFVVKNIRGKGRGVYCGSDVIKQNTYIMEYAGDCLSVEEAKSQEVVYKENGEGCYMIFFRYMEKACIIGATIKWDHACRLINHATNPNCQVHPPMATDLKIKAPRLAIYALKNILKGEEITIDYGVRNKHIPWLNCSEGDFFS